MNDEDKQAVMSEVERAKSVGQLSAMGEAIRILEEMAAQHYGNDNYVIRETHRLLKEKWDKITL